MRDLVLVDTQPARVRLFREAIAVYRERFLHLQARTDDGLNRARAQVERAREACRAVDGTFALRKARRRDVEGPGRRSGSTSFPARWRR